MSTDDGASACGCVAKVNRGMASRNARLECAESATGEMIPIVWTVPLDVAVSASTQLPVVAANFCPFCGREIMRVTCERN